MREKSYCSTTLSPTGWGPGWAMNWNREGLWAPAAVEMAVAIARPAIARVIERMMATPNVGRCQESSILAAGTRNRIQRMGKQGNEGKSRGRDLGNLVA